MVTGQAAMPCVKSASLIRAELRETDTGARWGGDEFTIIAPNTGQGRGGNGSRSAFVCASRRHEADWPMTASIGVATLDCDDIRMPVDAHTLLRNADAAMYEAKRRGKNTVVAGRIIGRSEDQQEMLSSS